MGKGAECEPAQLGPGEGAA
jgi:hypothetical protein